MDYFFLLTNIIFCLSFYPFRITKFLTRKTENISHTPPCLSHHFRYAPLSNSFLYEMSGQCFSAPPPFYCPLFSVLKNDVLVKWVDNVSQNPSPLESPTSSNLSINNTLIQLFIQFFKICKLCTSEMSVLCQPEPILLGKSSIQ